MSGTTEAGRDGVVVRPRHPEDLAGLGELLAEQQASTEYPLRWPLPMGVERFLARPGEQAAWVAEVDGVLAGHVAVGVPDVDDELAAALLEVLGPERGPRASLVTVLFVGRGHTGRGLGGLLLATATEWIQAQGRVPALDVVPTHDRAVGLYLAHGWREVGRLRPAWLPEERPDLLLMTLG